MRITRAHADYWAARRAPEFLRGTYKPLSKLYVAPVTVDTLINQQVWTKDTWNLETLNAVTLVSRVRRMIGRVPEHGHYTSMQDYLAYLITSEPGRHKRRVATAKKWLARLVRDESARATLEMLNR